MILGLDAVVNMAQAQANMSNTEQLIYKRKTGELMFCAKGNISLLKQVLNPGEQLEYIQSIKPESWPKND